MEEDCLRVGVITSPHGVKGEVNVYPTTDDVNRFNTYGTCILDTKKGPVTMKIQNVKFFKNMVILKLDQLNSMDDAESMRNVELYVHRSQSPLKEGEFYLCDLMGLTAVLEDGSEVGEVTDILETGANDVYEITRKDGRILLLPAIPACVKKIDLEAGKMVIFILPGLEE